VRDIKRKIPANGDQGVSAQGDFIFLKSATGSVAVDIQGRGQVGLEVGDNIKIAGGFKEFRIINKTNDDNTVEIAVGDGDSFARSIVSGSVEISNELILKETGPHVLSATKYNRDGITSSVNTIVAATANTDGILISSIASYVEYSSCKVGMNPTIPASINDAAVLYSQARDSDYKKLSESILVLPVIVPAGQGLYEANGRAGNYSRISMTFKVL